MAGASRGRRPVSTPAGGAVLTPAPWTSSWHGPCSRASPGLGRVPEPELPPTALRMKRVWSVRWSVGPAAQIGVLVPHALPDGPPWHVPHAMPSVSSPLRLH